MLFQSDPPPISKIQKLELEIERLRAEVDSLRAIASDRARADKVFRTHLARVELIADCLPDVVLVQSNDMIYVDFWAESHSKLLVSPSRFIGRRPSDVLPVALSDKAMKCHALCLSTGQSHRYYYSVEKPTRIEWYQVIMVSRGEKVISFIRNVSNIIDDHDSERFHDILPVAP